LEEALYVIKSINSHSSLPNPLSLQEVQWSRVCRRVETEAHGQEPKLIDFSE
jgi:hypothetical protein